jgi:hypothetical protein
MYRFLKLPHLPEGRVRSLAVGERYIPRLGPALERLDIEVLGIPDNPHVDPRLAGHADLSFLHLGGGSFVTAGGGAAPDREPEKLIRHLGGEIRHSEMAQGPAYPADAGLNVCILGGRVFYNPRSADSSLIKGRQPIPVRQGYTRCAVCVVDGQSFITGDAGIAAAAGKWGLDVLLVRPGHILLDGFDTGFLGGTAWKLSEDRLAFTGSLKEHPDHAAIEHFLHVRGIEPIYLSDGPAFDIGSAVLLTETTQ